MNVLMMGNTGACDKSVRGGNTSGCGVCGGGFCVDVVCSNAVFLSRSMATRSACLNNKSSSSSSSSSY